MTDSFTTQNPGKLYIKGKNQSIIFHNEQNSFSVLRIRVYETNCDLNEESITVTGFFSALHENEDYIFYGVVTDHIKFGLQFKATSYERIIPESKEALITYFQSSKFPGIGKKTANNIVNHLGVGAFKAILNNPAILYEVPNLKKGKADLISDIIKKTQGDDYIILRLTEFGFSSQLSIKILQKYKENTIKIITENPYFLITDIDGIGFNKADEIALYIGFNKKSHFRIQGALYYVCEQTCFKKGHTYLKIAEIIPSVQKILDFDRNDPELNALIDKELEFMNEEKKLILEDDNIFLPTLYFSEKKIAQLIKKRLQISNNNDAVISMADFLLHLGDVEEENNITYEQTQRDGIFQALNNKITICTGGPGTGKTTIIKGIIQVFAKYFDYSLTLSDFKDRPFPVVLTAPTGRAAKRMTEATNLPATTIHRLLGWNGSSNFNYDEQNQLNGELFIIDETSMIDSSLMSHLLRAIPDQATIVLVGDEDQLPSVGPGQVLRDLLKSNTIPTVYLKIIFRQAEQSTVIKIAHDIKNGLIPTLIASQQNDYSFFPCTTNQVTNAVQKITEIAIRKGFSPKDIQVLAPMYRGTAGIDSLNKTLQETLNPNINATKKELILSNVVFRIGDKVLHLTNRPEDNVYNGDIGQIISITYAKDSSEKKDELYVSYDGLEIRYFREELIQITHAFCCSIHKSQGSEFPIVILPIVKGYSRMLKKNLIYTAITRAKDYLIICGELDTISICVKDESEQNRNTKLIQQLNVVTNKINNNTPENCTTNVGGLSYEEYLFSTNPMVGMENISPYYFIN